MTMKACGTITEESQIMQRQQAQKLFNAAQTVLQVLCSRVV